MFSSTFSLWRFHLMLLSLRVFLEGLAFLELAQSLDRLDLLLIRSFLHLGRQLIGIFPPDQRLLLWRLHLPTDDWTLK